MAEENKLLVDEQVNEFGDSLKQSYFNDGERRIDFMIAYQDHHHAENAHIKKYYESFLESLSSSHLEFEHGEGARRKSKVLLHFC